MGNSLVRFLCGGCFKPFSGDDRFGFHGDTPAALAQDLLQFESTSKVPDGLSSHVVSSKKAQANWYAKIGKAWKKAKPQPQTPEAAASFIIQTLKGHQKADVEGLLAFYGLPLSPPATELTEVPSTTPPPKPKDVKVILHSLPVDLKSIADGDTVTVYVDAADRKESPLVPKEVRKAAAARAKFIAAKDLKAAKTQHKIITDAGYRVVDGRKGDGTLARKYRIRLRGIDAPESSMPYGNEAKEELVKMVEGKRAKVYVYETDLYGRSVGDIYCNGAFVQEMMLRRGFAWHYDAYDKRPELAAWEKEARKARVGLWAQANPEKPWEYRRKRRNGA